MTGEMTVTAPAESFSLLIGPLPPENAVVAVLSSPFKTGDVVSPTSDFDKAFWADLKELGYEC